MKDERVPGGVPRKRRLRRLREGGRSCLRRRPRRARLPGEDPPFLWASSRSIPIPAYAFSRHSRKLPHGRAAAAGPPSSFAAAIRTSGIDRVSRNGVTTGCPNVIASPPCPAGAISSPHSSRKVGVGRTRSDREVVSSRKEAKETIVGTLRSASSNLREGGRVNAGFVAPDRRAIRNAPFRIPSTASRTAGYPLSAAGSSSPASAP